MSKVFVGNITSNSERLLNEYLSKFMPDAVVEPLKVAGIITRIKNHAVKPDVVLVILDEALYNNVQEWQIMYCHSLKCISM